MPVNSSNTAGYILNIGAVGISGFLFGMPVEALILGGMAGAAVHGLSKPSPRGISTVLASVMLAGSLTPILMHYASQYADLPEGILKTLIPVAVGGGWPWLWPVVSKHLRNWIDAVLSRFGGGK